MKILGIAGLIGMLVLTGCATLSSEKYDVSVQSSKDVKIMNVTVKHHENHVDVQGTLRPNASSVTRVGHVDVEFVGEGGTVLKTIKADTNTNQFSRKSSRRPTFSASAEIEAFRSVRLVHHPDTLQQCEL